MLIVDPHRCFAMTDVDSVADTIDVLQQLHL